MILMLYQLQNITILNLLSSNFRRFVPEFLALMELCLVELMRVFQSVSLSGVCLHLCFRIIIDQNNIQEKLQEENFDLSPRSYFGGYKSNHN